MGECQANFDIEQSVNSMCDAPKWCAYLSILACYSLRPPQCALACVSYVLADVGTGASSNTYLPPQQNGYNYEPPNTKFNKEPTRQQPNQVRSPN